MKQFIYTFNNYCLEEKDTINETKNHWAIEDLLKHEVNSKTSHSFMRTKKWLFDNHPEFLM